MNKRLERLKVKIEMIMQGNKNMGKERKTKAKLFKVMVQSFQSFNLLIIFILLINYSCTEKKVDHLHAKDTSEVIYFCPMDTQIVQNKPGTCPICKMDLVPKPAAHQHESMKSQDWVYKPVNASVLSNVKSIKPVYKSVTVKIHAPGYVTYDERRINAISAKTGGRIERLNVKYNYQPVKKGQALFEIFSHDLQTAQQEYLYLKRSDPDEEVLNAAKRKLLLIGMTEAQINGIQSAGHTHATTTVYSPYTGFVIDEKNNKEVFISNESMGSNAGMGRETSMKGNNKEISLREGAYVGKGEAVFKVANTDVVWAIFEVFTDQLTQIKVNQPVHIMLENSNEMIMAKVNFIEPAFKEGSGTVKVRVYLDNKNQDLKIGNLLSGEIEAGEKKGLWIPLSSTYDLGVDKIVFLKRNGVFETRKISAGYSSQNEIEVIDGLTEGEEIAENAQFLVDSESFVKVVHE
jgi:membrane fusion protein, copper/silver efflux system